MPSPTPEPIGIPPYAYLLRGCKHGALVVVACAVWAAVDYALNGART